MLQAHVAAVAEAGGALFRGRLWRHIFPGCATGCARGEGPAETGG